MVLLVLDGLGWNALQEHARRLPTISGMSGGAITTVVPSTTATALTSICTGLTPAQHGVLGYRMVVGGEVLNVLRWSSHGRASSGPLRRAAPHRVPRPRCPGRHQVRVPQQRVQQCPPPRRALHRLEHRIGAGRALRPTGRGPAIGSCTRTTRASTTSRTSSACTTASTNASSGSRIVSSATSSRRCRPAPCWS